MVSFHVVLVALVQVQYLLFVAPPAEQVAYLEQDLAAVPHLVQDLEFEKKIKVRKVHK